VGRNIDPHLECFTGTAAIKRVVPSCRRFLSRRHARKDWAKSGAGVARSKPAVADACRFVTKGEPIDKAALARSAASSACSQRRTGMLSEREQQASRRARPTAKIAATLFLRAHGRTARSGHRDDARRHGFRQGSGPASSRWCQAGRVDRALLTSPSGGRRHARGGVGRIVCCSSISRSIGRGRSVLCVRAFAFSNQASGCSWKSR
jgi:hypothetical protein